MLPILEISSKSLFTVPASNGQEGALDFVQANMTTFADCIGVARHVLDTDTDVEGVLVFLPGAHSRIPSNIPVRDAEEVMGCDLFTELDEILKEAKSGGNVEGQA